MPHILLPISHRVLAPGEHRTDDAREENVHRFSKTLPLIASAALATLGAIGCGSHAPLGYATTTGEGTDAGPGLGTTPGGGPCVNLQCQQAACASGKTTTLTGVVYAPAAAGDPLFNAVVYVPNAPLDPFSPGVACDQCGALASGWPIATTLSDAHGNFRLTDVPAGDNIPLVIQIGRWRKQITIPHVDACNETRVAPTLTHLPRNQSEGDIPHMAIATGAVDPLECVLRKIGIDDGEFTPPSGSGRIHYYVSNGAQMRTPAPAAGDLWNSVDALKRYDMVLLPCEGAPNYKPNDVVQNLIDYTSAGGRVFTTHFGYVWIQGAPPPFSKTAVWSPQTGGLADPLPASVDTTFPKGAALATWMLNFDEGMPLGEVDISEPRHDALIAVPPSQPWITFASPSGGAPSVQQYTFNTPLGTSVDKQCGRVSYSDFHVDHVDESYVTSAPTTFPAECGGTALSSQERILEFMLFDLASCIQKDSEAPHPPPTK
jgi:hypothetical protein